MEQRSEGGRKQEDTLGRSVPGRENSKYKGPGAGMCQSVHEGEVGGEGDRTIKGRDMSPETTLWEQFQFRSRKDEVCVQGTK